MSFIGSGWGRSTIPSSESRPQAVTAAGGITLASPDGVDGALHLVVEAPPAPLVVADIDLSVPTEQVVEILAAQGRYIADSLVFFLADGNPAGATVTVRTLDAARGGGVALASAAGLSALTDRKAIVQLPLSLGRWHKAPHLYVTVAGGGTGTVRMALFGRILDLDDPDARTYGRRRIDRLG